MALWLFTKEAISNAKPDPKLCVAMSTPLNGWTSVPKSYKARIGLLKPRARKSQPGGPRSSRAWP